MIQALLSILFIASVRSDPQFISLSQFLSKEIYTLGNVERGAKLYLASSDDNRWLKNIRIRSGANSITLDDLNNFNDDGTPKSFLVTSDLYLTTTNERSTMAKMTGNLYITTKFQADDPDFSVYVIKDQHTIRTNAIQFQSIQSTMVILNTWQQKAGIVDDPQWVSYVTEIEQSPNTNISFHWGIPKTEKPMSTPFFRLPVYYQYAFFVPSVKVLFDDVEPLLIELEAWYITAVGPTSMKIDKKYFRDHKSNLTATNSTGLIMTSGIYREHVVNFTPDKTREGSFGIYFQSYNQSGSAIGVYMRGVSAWIEGVSTRDRDYQLSTGSQAVSLTVNATKSAPGTFFCQYFTYAEEFIRSTTTTATKTTLTAAATTTERHTSTVSTTGTTTSKFEHSTTLPTTELQSTVGMPSTTTVDVSTTPTKAPNTTRQAAKTTMGQVSTTTVGTSTKGSSRVNKLGVLMIMTLLWMRVI